MENLTPAGLRRESFRCAAAVYGKTVLAWLIALMLAMSLSVIFTALGTEPNGYDIYEDGKFLYHVDLIDEDDPTQDTEIKLEDNQTYTETRTALSNGAAALQGTLQLVMSLVILYSFPFHTLWTRGDKDRNRTDFDRMRVQPLRGLWIGLLADVPALVSYGLLWLCPAGVLTADYLALYRIAHIPTIRYMQWFVPTATTGNALTAGQLLALLPPLLLLPLICAFAYWVGFKRFGFMEKLVYRRKKD